jgi:hypothetical protein
MVSQLHAFICERRLPSLCAGRDFQLFWPDSTAVSACSCRMRCVLVRNASCVPRRAQGTCNASRRQQGENNNNKSIKHSQSTCLVAALTRQQSACGYHLLYHSMPDCRLWTCLQRCCCCCCNYQRADPRRFIALLECLSFCDYSMAIKAGVHFTLCGGTICKLGEQTSTASTGVCRTTQQPVATIIFLVLHQAHASLRGAVAQPASHGFVNPFLCRRQKYLALGLALP